MKNLFNGITVLYIYFALFSPLFLIGLNFDEMNVFEYVLFFCIIILAISSLITISENWKDKKNQNILNS